MTLLPALALLGASALAADPPWLVKEFTPERIAEGASLMGSRSWLSAGRFKLLGIVRGEPSAVAPRGPRYRLLDLETLGTVDVEIPFKDFPREHLETLGIKERQGAELVHHGGDVTSMLVDKLDGYRRAATYFVQYDHRARRWSRMVKLGDHDAHRYLHTIGFDPTDARYYFAYAVNDEQDASKDGPLRYDLARVDLRTLEIDWRLSLPLPRRAKQLRVNAIRFSPDGGRLALAEYNDRAGERDHPAKPRQLVHVVDLSTRAVDTYPIPLSAYGLAFTPDSRFLLVGSHEEGTILRIDVAARKQTHAVKATPTIHEFHAAPSGAYFLVVNDYELSPRKVVDVRSAADLSLVTSLPIDDLFPGCSKGSPGFDATRDGRFLLAGSCRAAGRDGPSGFWVLRPPERIDAPETGSAAAARLRAGETLAGGQALAKRSGIELSEFAMGSFRSAVLSAKGNALVAGVRGSSAVIAKVAPGGKRLWERVLPPKRFQEQAGGVLAPTADDGCVAYFLSYVTPGHGASARLVRVGADGRVRWDLNFAPEGAPDAPFANDGLELRPDGSVLLRGIVQVGRGTEKPWTAVVGPDGRLVSSDPPVAAPTNR